MKQNISLVPHIISKNPSLGLKLFYGFYKIGLAKMKPKRDYGCNHFNNLGLVYFKLTGACNLRCVMCGQYGERGVMKDCAAEENKKILPVETWKKFVDEIAPRKPVIYVWGGEPFLYPDLLPLAKHIVDKGLFLSVNTNGTLIEKHAERIVRDKWTAIFVSLDAFRGVNDELRGKGSYDRVIAGFAALNREKQKQKSKYPFLGVVTVVTNKNYADLANLAEASREFNLDMHIFNLGTYTNDNIVATQRKFMKEKLDTDIDCLDAYNTGYNLGIDGKKLHDILMDIHNKNYGHPMLTVPVLNPEKTHTYYAELETPVRNRCIVPWCQANVNYNGDVHFCADYPDYILGNITRQSFKDIINGDRANLFRKTIHECEGGMFPGCLRCYQNMLFGNKIKGY
uniref:Radical SAM domain protein n=1 Tax=uncultured bacterium contig00032 TaxID=1181521 RepID=A0A806JY15_9BACT|nr:radical SAM domain protein [uncultured bacterium contig00032]